MDNRADVQSDMRWGIRLPDADALLPQLPALRLPGGGQLVE